MSNIRNTNFYTNLCTKITHDSTLVNGDNTHDKSCQLKLNDMDCHGNYHVGFGVQVSAQVGVPSITI